MRNIYRIIKLTKPLIRIELLLALLIFLTALLSQVYPLVSKAIVDEIEDNIKTGDGSVDTLFILIALGFAINIISSLLSSASERLGDHFSAQLQKYLTEKFYQKVLFLPQAYFDSEISGKIVNQLSRGINSIKGFTNTATNFILPTILQTIFTILILVYYNLPTAIFVTLLFPLYISISYVSAKKWGKEEVKKNRIEDITRGRIQEVISSIKVVKSFNNEKTEYDFISNQIDQSNKIYAKQSSTFHIYDFLRNSGLNIVILGVSVVVFYSAFQGNISIGEMVLIIQLVSEVRRPLFAMSFILTQIQNTESGSKEFFEILDLQEEGFLSDSIDRKRIQNPSIEFQNVGFKYRDSDEVLENLSFTLHPKEKVALVGHSGAGKTTIINLILKFYEPTVGRILLKGRDYADLDARYIRNNMALVFQDNELFLPQ